MKILCSLGLHKWNGCKCANCGKTRDEGHKFLSSDCNRCSNCDTKRDRHPWNGCKCAKCGKTREEGHDWNGCKCANCGKTRDEGHKFLSSDCNRCSNCDTKRDRHSWNGCKCAKCGKTREEGHDWNGCKCANCGKTREEGHDWSKDCEQCSKCGKKRDVKHAWENNLGPCRSCGAINPVRSLIGMIADPNQTDYYTNENTAQKLKSVLSDEVLASVIGLLTSDSCCVRSHAATALRVFGDKRAIGPLTNFLEKSYNDEHVGSRFFPGGGRGRAIEALQELAGREAVPALIEALKDPVWTVREYAAAALCKLEDERAIESLEKLMLPVKADIAECPETRAREWALRALQKLVGDEVLEWCKTRAVTHTWVGCKCSTCGKTVHKWTHGKCSGCGIIRRHAFGFTDLHEAIHENADLNEIRNLCSNDLVNVGDREGFTPLMKASGEDGNLVIVKLLVELGADINAHSTQGTSALSMAALHRKHDVVEYLEQRGAIVDFAVRRF